MRPSKWAFVMPEPYARKPACAVLGELGGGDAARLPGARQAKLGASCRMKVPVGKGLTIYLYRVLHLWRSLKKYLQAPSQVKCTQRVIQAVGESALPKVLV